MSEEEELAAHHLRPTPASHLALVGVERFVIGRLLNHVETGLTKVYVRHRYDAEKRIALETWGRWWFAAVRSKYPRRRY